MDHSTPEAFAFLIEADEKRVFYSGDFRASGRKGKVYRNLIENPPRRYWSDLKRKLNSEGFYQLYEIIVQLIMIYQKQRKKRIKKGGKKIASTKLAASF
ncbi:MAG: hypothetical protein WCG82_06975 [Bacteroidota bacterium]